MAMLNARLHRRLNARQNPLRNARSFHGTVRSAFRLAAPLILAASFTAGRAGAQPKPLLRLDADIARFSAADSATFVELSYGLSESALTYRRDSTGFSAAADMSLEIRSGDRTAASREWSIQRTIPESLAHLSAQNILSIETIALPAGDYTVVLCCRDRYDPARRDSVVLPVHAGPVAAGAEALSDIELCSRITPSADRASLFYKNTLEVIPNPSRLYGEGLSVLHFYAEIYNLAAAGDGDVVIRAAITDPSGNVVVSTSKTKPRANNSSVEYGSMNIASLPGGTYLFRLSVEDGAAASPRVLAVSEKKFFIYQPDPSVARVRGQGVRPGDEFASMSGAAVEDEIRKIRYIASEPERDQMENLTDTVARLNFLREFWSGRDPDGTTLRNEARVAYLGRIAQADEAYRERGREGWLSDRGRVLVLYGPPDNIDRHPSEPETHPFEVWSYHTLQGGVEFVFVDDMGFGGYRLVHSSHLDELRNDNWYEEEAKIH